MELNSFLFHSLWTKGVVGNLTRVAMCNAHLFTLFYDGFLLFSLLFCSHNVSKRYLGLFLHVHYVKFISKNFKYFKKSTKVVKIKVNWCFFMKVVVLRLCMVSSPQTWSIVFGSTTTSIHTQKNVQCPSFSISRFPFPPTLT